MRITSNTIYENLIKYINENYDKINSISEKISSGKKINNLSDYPVDAEKILTLNKKINSINQYSRNITTASIWLKTTDNTIISIKNLNTRVKELTTQASTETYTYEQRKLLSSQIVDIAENIMELANTEINGQYIFSGYKMNVKPYELNIESDYSNYSIEDYNYKFDLNLTIRMIDSDHYEFSVDGENTWIDNNGQGFAINSINPLLGFSINATNPHAGDTVKFNITHEYQGDNGNFEIKIDDSQTLNVNKLGKEIFTPNDEKNIFKVLGNIWAGMITNNREMISNQIEKLNNIEINLLDNDADIGLKQDLLENFKIQFLDEKKENLNQQLAEIQDTNIAEAMTDLAKQQMIYQATLKTTAMITNLTILNYI